MITAIDTNILLDILLPNELFCDAAVEALERSAGAGSLVVCDLVYAELCVHFADQPECDEFLTVNEIRVEPLTRESHFSASRVWRAYRQQGAERPEFSPTSWSELTRSIRRRGYFLEIAVSTEAFSLRSA